MLASTSTSEGGEVAGEGEPPKGLPPPLSASSLSGTPYEDVLLALLERLRCVLCVGGGGGRRG